jgi:hypothetical protein
MLHCPVGLANVTKRGNAQSRVCPASTSAARTPDRSQVLSIRPTQGPSTSMESRWIGYLDNVSHMMITWSSSMMQGIVVGVPVHCFARGAML